MTNSSSFPTPRARALNRLLWWILTLLSIKLNYFWGSTFYFGNSFKCPCCGGTSRKFLSGGEDNRPSCKCPRCGSYERHRLLWLYLKNRTIFFRDNLKVLHVGPWRGIQERFQSLPNINYLGIDNFPSNPHIMRMDVTSLKLPDNYFDLCICLQVLEHIPNDKKAISEIFRVLKPGGQAILQVPIQKELKKTVEYMDTLTPEKYERITYERYHVRSYGLDFKHRLENVGFIVNIDDSVKKMNAESVRRYSLNVDEELYVCLKPGTRSKLHTNKLKASS